mgnify:CR=1 FL=1
MAVNNEVFLGSGASLTLVPELDFKIIPETTVAEGHTSVQLDTAAVTSSNTGMRHFQLVDDLYKGCTLELYDASTGVVGLAAPTISNAGTQIQADESVITNTPINALGSLASTGAELFLNLLEHQNTVTFAAEGGSNYNSGYLTILLASASGGTSSLAVLFDARSATVASPTVDDDVEVNIANSATGEEIAEGVLQALSGKALTVVRSGAMLTITNTVGGYVGANMIAESTTTATTIPGTDTQIGGIIQSVTVVNAGTSVSGADNLTITSTGGTNGILALAAAAATSNSLVSTHTVTTNNSTTLTFTPAVGALSAGYSSADYFILKGYGAPCPAPTHDKSASGRRRLNADNWLGLVESASFPSVEVEMKQMNLQLGGTRNFTHQYKGIETAQGGNINLVANHASWLYYFLGKCDSISFGTTPSGSVQQTEFLAVSGSAGVDAVLVDNGAILSEGPMLYRTMGTADALIVPPLMPTDAKADMDKLTLPTTTSHFLTYTFSETDINTLPSFALEQTLSKLESTNKYHTDSSSDRESKNFVRIARGNMVNSMTLTGFEHQSS